MLCGRCIDYLTVKWKQILFLYDYFAVEYILSTVKMKQSFADNSQMLDPYMHASTAQTDNIINE